MTFAAMLTAVAMTGTLIVSVHAQQTTNFTPKVPNGNLTLTTGGTAQAFQTSGTNVGCVIVNPTTATEQGIGAAEAIWVNLTGTATAAAGGASIPVEAGSFLQTGPTSKAISWIAATTGHLVAGYCQ